MQLKCFTFPLNMDLPKGDRISLHVRQRDSKEPQGTEASSPGLQPRLTWAHPRKFPGYFWFFPGLVIAFLCYSEAENVVLLFFPYEKKENFCISV